ncbi:MAG: ABC transporter ATP-binding protein, partial [Clostridia bacterium]|nr:ABC transporter ATP-binding protein [Clostridia bacterium]
LRKDKTCIFVSHRLSSATVANKIIVLEQGAVIEQGNHAELMKKRGVYYELFTTQAKRYITPIDGVSAEEFMSDDEDIARFLDERKEGRHSRRPGPEGQELPERVPEKAGKKE